MALPPHAPCRLQLGAGSAECLRHHALPPHAPCRLQRWCKYMVLSERLLCLHTPRADCNCGVNIWFCLNVFFASTRPVQIATSSLALKRSYSEAFASTRPVQIATRYRRQYAQRFGLCLHTPRADCNGRNAQNAICTFQNVC